MKPSYKCDWSKVYATDALSGAKLLEPQSVHTIVTSPPYWGLRSYLDKDDPKKVLELGAEKTPEELVERLVEVFRALRPALRDDGTLWLNLGDSYNSNPSWGRGKSTLEGRPQHLIPNGLHNKTRLTGLKQKDLIGLPWMVAFALRSDGWYLRSEVIWAKGSCMPESVTDRPTRSHEHMFLLSKRPRYFYDAHAVREPSVSDAQEAHQQKYARVYDAQVESSNGRQPNNTNSKGIHSRPGLGGRNLRDVWKINPRPYAGSNYATFPLDLLYPCINAGTSERGVCEACGAPWGRIVEKAGETTQKRASENGYADHANAYPGAKQNLDFRGSHWKQTEFTDFGTTTQGSESDESV